MACAAAGWIWPDATAVATGGDTRRLDFWVMTEPAAGLSGCAEARLTGWTAVAIGGGVRATIGAMVGDAMAAF